MKGEIKGKQLGVVVAGDIQILRIVEKNILKEKNVTDLVTCKRRHDKDGKSWEVEASRGTGTYPYHGVKAPFNPFFTNRIPASRDRGVAWYPSSFGSWELAFESQRSHTGF